jgi:hypothetical protein
MKFHRMVKENKFTLVVSLPSNDIRLVKAALRGGADAIKCHINVWHRASGHNFGSFGENRDFIKALVDTCSGTPAGLVCGADSAYINEEELREIEKLGIDFFSSYAAYLPNFMMESAVLSRMAAIDSGYNQNTLDGINVFPPDVLECSIQSGEAYHSKMTFADVLRYADIASKVKIPCLVPTQKWMAPAETRALYKAGCKALMIGAVVMGKDPAEYDVEKCTAAFAEAVQRL